jgi:SOS-response transcriptional repressor LexA
MEVIERLIAAVRASGIKQNHIAHVSGLGTTKLNKILNRHQVPTIPDFMAIAQAIHIDPARLFTDREVAVELAEVREVYAASQQLQRIVEGWLPDIQATRVAPAAQAFPKVQQRHDVTPVRAAANPNAEMVVEMETTRKLIPRRFWNRQARIIARADGDSMDGGSDPIGNGELVYLKPTRSARNANGKVVLCRVDDALYLKIFQKSGKTVRLISTNHPDAIELDASANLQIYGVLVDHAPE